MDDIISFETEVEDRVTRPNGLGFSRELNARILDILPTRVPLRRLDEVWGEIGDRFSISFIG